MKTLITTIRQIDGSNRRVYAQDVPHARIAREILRQDPAMIDHLNGTEGIQITVEDGE